MSVVVVRALPQSKVASVLQETTAGAGSLVRDITLDADSMLVSLIVRQLGVGATFNLVVDTVGNDDNDTLRILAFPTITTPMTELLLKQPLATLDRVRFSATYTGAVDYEVRVKALGLGEVATRPLGVSAATTSGVTSGVTPGVIIPATLEGRSGLMVMNYNTTGILYVGFSAAEVTGGAGWPVFPNGGSISADLDSGVALWGTGTQPIDVRIMQGGGG